MMISRLASAARLTGQTVKIDRVKKIATVFIPHLSPNFIDRNGAMNPFAVQHLLTGEVRVMAYNLPPEGETKPFLDYDEVTKDIVFMFMASTKTEISPAFYGLINEVVQPSFAVELKLGCFGTSSVATWAEFKDLNTGTVFAKNITQAVAASKITRKPVSLPQWWREKYASWQQNDAFELKIPIMEKPEKCFDYKVIVQWNDTAADRYTSYISYIKYCRDAATDAVDKGFFSHLLNDLLNYPFQNMQMTYKRASKPNQELNVSVWEDSANPYLLHFDISRGESTIFQSSIESQASVTTGQ